MSRAQFNLLPDAKLASAKSDRLRARIVSISIIISTISAAVFVLLFATSGVLQKNQLSGADKSIAEKTAELRAIEGLDKIITVHNQLNTLVELHKNKHISSRIFSYLAEVTPSKVTVTRVAIDFAANTLLLDGTADSQKTINTFVDTLKFTTYTVDTDDSATKAFPTVVESSFSIAADNTASFSINATFEEALFANSNLDNQGHPKTPDLKVPNVTTTGSVAVDPASVINDLNGGGR